jgi:SAM-dependent methyltransferase
MWADDDAAIRFDHGAAYERFMGCWSRAAGALFLDWLAPPAEARWLEIGCGTGAFTELILQRCRPAAIVAVDPAPAQVAYARRRTDANAISFHVASAEALPCSDESQDVVVSALALNFIADRPAALREMRRVARAHGIIAAYVWDFAGGRMPNAPLVKALRHLKIVGPAPPGGRDCALAPLRSLLAGAGLTNIETTALDIAVTYADFTTFWHAQTPSFSPTTRLIARMSPAQRAALINVLCRALPLRPDGSIAYLARAHAVRGCLP